MCDVNKENKRLKFKCPSCGRIYYFYEEQLKTLIEENNGSYICGGGVRCHINVEQEIIEHYLPDQPDEEIICKLYTEGLKKYTSKDFEAAKDLFEKIMDINPDDWRGEFFYYSSLLSNDWNKYDSVSVVYHSSFSSALYEVNSIKDPNFKSNADSIILRYHLLTSDKVDKSVDSISKEMLIDDCLQELTSIGNDEDYEECIRRECAQWLKIWVLYKAGMVLENKILYGDYLDIDEDIYESIECVKKFDPTFETPDVFKKRTTYNNFSSYNSFSSSSSKQGCYVATCVYNSYDCPEVWRLRRYRDYYLDNHWWGKIFIKLYYSISPTLVKVFGKQKWFKSFTKKILDKKINKLDEEGYESTQYNDKY